LKIFTTYDLCKWLKEKKIYLIKYLEEKYTTKVNNKNENYIRNVDNNNNFIAISYSWSMDLNKIIDFIIRYKKENNIKTNFIWLDIIFINQNEDFQKQAYLIDNIYKISKYHFVVGDDALDRVWCLYEIYVRFNMLKTNKDKNKENPRFINQKTTSWLYLPIDYKDANSTYENDKDYIKKIINVNYGLQEFHDDLNYRLYDANDSWSVIWIFFTSFYCLYMLLFIIIFKFIIPNLVSYIIALIIIPIITTPLLVKLVASNHRKFIVFYLKKPYYFTFFNLLSMCFYCLLSLICIFIVINYVKIQGCLSGFPCSEEEICFNPSYKQ